MRQERRKQMISCVMAVILFFVGMSVDKTMVKSSFFGVYTQEKNYLCSVNYITEDAVIVTPGMLIKNNILIFHENTISSTLKWNRIVPLILGNFGQYLFGYENTESKEDAQLFLCRSIIVDYIHLKDSGE